MEDDFETESDLLTHRVKENIVFDDGFLSEEEEAKLVGMDCDDVKELFRTNREICIYFLDVNRNAVRLTNGTVDKYGVGCGGIVVNGTKCGEVIN